MKEKTFYVYGHYLEDGTLFYIGKGSGKRLNSTSRSNTWKEYTAGKEWYARIIEDNLTLSRSLELEKSLILSNKTINVRINTETKKIPISFSSLFSYSEISPTGLIWNEDRVGNNGRAYYKTGDVAGRECQTSDGKGKRYVLVIGGEQFFVHRIVYSLFYPISTERVIDHIDGNSLNNNISNLREVPQWINSKNTVRTCKSNTGVSGVTRTRRKKLNYNCYIASWYDINSNLKSKEFSANKHGEDEAFRLACEWRKEQIRLLNEQGAGYTERHGT